MTEELKRYESSIDKQYSFRWTPEYEEEFRTNLNETVFSPITKEVIEQLGWELIYEAPSLIEVRKNASGFNWGQNLTISYQSGKIKIKSQSIQSPFFDFGRNSKRVKLFIYAFKALEKNYDKETLSQLEEAENKANNWDDYEIPDTLPQPKGQLQSKPWLSIVGGISISILLGFIIAFLSIKLVYIFGVYEVVTAFLIGFGFKYLIKSSHYTNFSRLSYLLFGVVSMTYILNEYFMYSLMMLENNMLSIGFFDFIQIRLQNGLTIDSLNTGSIGLVISWLFQIGLTYAIAYTQLATHITQYQFEKTPPEVVDFAFYHLVKGKDENEVRKELAKMGWSKAEDQDDVFISVVAIQNIQELNRMG